MDWILLGISSLLIGKCYFWAFDEGAPKITILLLFLLHLGIIFFIIHRKRRNKQQEMNISNIENVTNIGGK